MPFVVQESAVFSSRDAVKCCDNGDGLEGTALPETVSAGGMSSLKISSLFSTPISERTMPMGPRSRHGKYACVTGASESPPVVAKDITDVTAQVMAAHITLIIGDTSRHTKVITQG